MLQAMMSWLLVHYSLWGSDHMVYTVFDVHCYFHWWADNWNLYLVIYIIADANNTEVTTNTTITARETHSTSTVSLNVPEGSNIKKVRVLVPDELYTSGEDNVVSESEDVEVIKPNPPEPLKIRGGGGGV